MMDGSGGRPRQPSPIKHGPGPEAPKWETLDTGRDTCHGEMTPLWAGEDAGSPWEGGSENTPAAGGILAAGSGYQTRLCPHTLRREMPGRRPGHGREERGGGSLGEMEGRVLTGLETPSLAPLMDGGHL